MTGIRTPMQSTSGQLSPDGIAVTGEICVSFHLHDINLSRTRPIPVNVIGGLHPYCYKWNKWISYPFKIKFDYSYIPGQIQSPLGILALISIVPYVKLNESLVTIRTDWIGLIISSPAALSSKTKVKSIETLRRNVKLKVTRNSLLPSRHCNLPDSNRVRHCTGNPH